MARRGAESAPSTAWAATRNRWAWQDCRGVPTLCVSMQVGYKDRERTSCHKERRGRCSFGGHSVGTRETRQEHQETRGEFARVVCRGRKHRVLLRVRTKRRRI
jgi:hypothetical protein